MVTETIEKLALVGLKAIERDTRTSPWLDLIMTCGDSFSQLATLSIVFPHRDATEELCPALLNFAALYAREGRVLEQLVLQYDYWDQKMQQKLFDMLPRLRTGFRDVEYEESEEDTPQMQPRAYQFHAPSNLWPYAWHKVM